MRLLGFVVVALTLGCKMDNPAFEKDTDTDSGDGSGTGASDDDPSSGDDVGDDGGDASGSGDDAGDTGDGGQDTGTGGSDDGDTDGIPLCPDYQDGFRPDIVVKFPGGGVYDGCNGPLDVEGPTVRMSENTWQIKVCSGGEKCNPDCPGEYITVEYNTAPGTDQYLLPAVPACAHILVEFADPDPAGGVCPFMNGAVWDVGNAVGGYDPLPYYMVGARGAHEPMYVETLWIEHKLFDPCECDSPDPGCCYKPPGEYKIKFGGLDGDPTMHEGEGSEATYTDIMLDVMNYQSHVDPGCGLYPDIDWVVKRYGG